MKYLFNFLFPFLSISGFSQHGIITLQDKSFEYKGGFDSVVWKSLEQEPAFITLNKQEQEFFYWTNVFRKNPKQFFAEVVKDFIRQFPEAKKPEVNSLEKDIQKSSFSLPPLIPDDGLLIMCKAHAKDLVKQGGVISHKSSTGKDFAHRINEAGYYKCGAENLFLGNNSPLEALVILLIDYGVPDKGHRQNLLNPSFGKMGIAMSELTSKKAITVQVFGCK
ncbi:MAG: CAP domain-containing protein [Chitinophagaceae bacterium]